jgi:WD40 repeat protein
MSINEALANSIARIVDDRVQKQFSQRDTVLSQMHQSLEAVASLLRDRTLQMQTLQQNMSSPNRHSLAAPDHSKGFRTPHMSTNKTVPFRPLGGSNTPGYFSPRRARTHRGIIISSKTRSGKNRLGYASKTLGNKSFLLSQTNTSQALVTMESSNNRGRAEDGTLLVPRAEALPRVARTKFHQSQGWTSPRDRHDHNTSVFVKKRQRVQTSENHRLRNTEASKTAIFRPSAWRASRNDKLPPTKGLVLEWVYGYGRSDKVASQLTNASTMHRLKTSELVWAVAGVCVIFDENRMTQRFFVGHDGEVSCLAVHPDGVLCASGQMGRSNAKICIWSTGPFSSFDNSSTPKPSIRTSPYDSSEFKFPRYAPEVCDSLQLSIGSGVAAVDFSPDGDYLLTVALNMHHTMTMWNWRNRHPLCSVKTHSSPVYLCAFNPYQFYVDENTKERVYTAVTAGQHHVKVWTLRFEREIDEEEEDSFREQQFNNANRGNVNTGFLSKNDRQLFTSLRSDGTTDLSTFHRGQWRYSFKPKETDKVGSDRVHYKARRVKGMTMEEPAPNNNGVPVQGRRSSGSSSEPINNIASSSGGGGGGSGGGNSGSSSSPGGRATTTTKYTWRMDGGMVKTRRIPNVPPKSLPGRDITLCMCFLPNGLGTGGACVTGSSTGRITLWHQQVEQGAAKMVPRATSRRGLVDRVITSWDPIGWQGVTVPNAHNGQAITAVVAAHTQTPDQQLRFLTGGRDNRVVLWDVPVDRVTSQAPQKMLALRVDSCPIHILPSFNKALVTTSNSGIVELDITGESPQLRPNVLLHGHQRSVNCIDTFPQASVPVFCTVGDDEVVRLWSLRERRQLTEALLPTSGTSCAFSNDGGLLVVGTADGGVLVYGVRSGYPPGLDLRFQDVPSKAAKLAATSSGKDAAGGWPAPNPRNTKRINSSSSPQQQQQQQASMSTRAKNSMRLPHAMTAVRFSPNGIYLVAASRDHQLYLYQQWNDPNALPGSFRQKAVLKGHWSAVTHVDWSSDGTTIMSNGADREILYWNPTTGKQDCATMAKRDLQWDTWTCVLGWPMQGAWSSKVDRGIVHDNVDKTARLFMSGNFRKDGNWLKDIRSGQHGYGVKDATSSAGEKGLGPSKQKRLAVETMNLLGVSKSNSGALLATGDDMRQVSLLRYPAVSGTKAKRYRGHGGMVKSVRFTEDDRFLLTAGGVDKSIFLWNVTSIDKDPTMLTMNFATSHLETSRLQQQQSKDRKEGGGQTKRKEKTRREDERTTEEAWNYLEGKTIESPVPKLAQGDQKVVRQASPLTKEEKENKKMWQYLEMEGEDDAGSGGGGGTSSSSAITTVTLNQDEQKKWSFLENDSTAMNELPVFDSLETIRNGTLHTSNKGVAGNDQEFGQQEEQVPPLFKVFGLFDFSSTGDHPDEIKEFQKDTPIWVTSTEEEHGWWRGRLELQGSWGLLFPKNRVYQVLEFQGEKYMLTTQNENDEGEAVLPEIFTLKNQDGEEEEEEEPTFIGNWNDVEKTLTDASGAVVDWSTAMLSK